MPNISGQGRRGPQFEQTAYFPPKTMAVISTIMTSNNCFIVCPKSILSNLLVLSGAFPFLFATNLFPQYRLNCFLRVQKHRSAEGILDICRRGEEQQTAKQKYSKYTKLQIKVKSTYEH